MSEKKRKGYSTIEQQMAADKRYRDKNKEVVAYKTARRSAKSFILSKATLEDLENILDYVSERRNLLSNAENSSTEEQES